MCRIINLLIYTLIVYFAIKIVPILKNALLLLALMPTTICVAASVSGDSLTNAVSFLLIALFLKLALIEDKIKSKDILLISIVSIAVSLTKFPYSLLSLLFFIIPYKKFQNIKNWIFTFICSCSVPLFISVFWNNKFNHLYSYLTNGFNVFLQTHTYNTTFVLSNPLNFLDLLINTIAYDFNNILSSFVASNVSNFLRMPLFLVYIYLIVLVFVSLYDVSDFKLNLKQKLFGISVFLIIFLSISVAELITWTPIGFDRIVGLQGRYFIPIAPLLLLVFKNSLKSSKLEKINEKFNLNIILVLYVVVFLSLSIFFILTKQQF